MPEADVPPLGASFLASPPIRTFSPHDFGSDEKLMIQTAEAFSRKEVVPLADRLEKQEEGLMPGLIRKAGDLGLCGIDSPEEFGGLSLSKNLAARILEFMSLDGSFSVTFGITSGIAQVGLALFGNDDQKLQYLPRLTSGEWIGAYALSEPNSGSDALSATTRADLKGDRYVLNGTKMWISNAKWADFFLVMAKLDGTSFSAFLVEKGFPGVSVSREEHKMGLKGSSTARLVLENAEVPVQNLLYKEGLGHHVAFNALNLGRFKLASMSIGPARAAIEVAARYAKERFQFGKPISSFGLIEKKFSLMASLFYVAESMTYRTGDLIEGAFASNEGTIEGARKSAEEFSVECSACKVFATEAEGTIVDEGLQVFGGYGFTEEFPIARHYRDARVSRIYEGTNEINRIFISDRVHRKIEHGFIPRQTAKDSFVSELCAEALRERPTSQVGIGAASDLILLTYAEQSSRLRALREAGTSSLLYQAALPYLNSRASEAYQTLTGNGVSLPPTPPPTWSDVAGLVYQTGGFPI